MQNLPPISKSNIESSHDLIKPDQVIKNQSEDVLKKINTEQSKAFNKKLTSNTIIQGNIQKLSDSPQLGVRIGAFISNCLNGVRDFFKNSVNTVASIYMKNREISNVKEKNKDLRKQIESLESLSKLLREERKGIKDLAGIGATAIDERMQEIETILNANKTQINNLILQIEDNEQLLKPRKIESEAISPTEAKAILKAFNERNDSKILEFQKKYGPQIADSDVLLQQINLIKDSGQRKKAMQYFLKFQLNLIGHELSLGGKIKINRNSSIMKSFINKLRGKLTKEVNLEGVDQNIPHLKLAESLRQYNSDKNLIQGSYIKAIENGAVINSLKTDEIDYNELVEEIKKGNPVAIPTGWLGHAVEITISNGRLAYSNKGQCSAGWTSGIQIFKIGNSDNINAEFLKKIISFRGKDKEEASSYFEKGGLEADLDLKKEIFIKKVDQKVGNCSWASTKCGLHSLLAMDSIPKAIPSIDPLLDKYREARNEWPITFNSMGISQEVAKDFKKIIDLQLESFDQSEMNTRLYKKFKKLSNDLDLLINFKPKENELENETTARFEIEVGKFPEVLKTCRLNLQELLDEKALFPAYQVYKNWSVEHRQKEYEFFLDFLMKNNINNKLFSNSEEIILLGEMFNKFLTDRGDTKIERYYNISEKSGVIGKEIYSLVKDVFSKKNYLISDSIVHLDVLKDDEKTKGDKKSEIVIQDLLRYKPGAFVITERGGVISLNYNVKDDQINSIPLDQVQIDGKPLTTLKELMQWVKNKTGAEESFPVINQKVIDRMITGKEGLD